MTLFRCCCMTPAAPSRARPLPADNAACLAARSVRRLSVAGLIGLIAFTGCRSTPEPPASEPGTVIIEELAERVEEEPIGIAQETGIEVHWWLVDDTNASVARALAPSRLALWSRSDGPATEFAPHTLEAWRSSGLRVFSLSPGSFAPLQQHLPPRHSWERLWLGQSVEWRELVAGRSLPRRELVRVEGTAVPVPAGRLRLLARAWQTPDANRAAIHLELLPQIAQRNPALAMDPSRQPDRYSELNAGRVFDTLHLRARLIPGRIYVIVPAAPDEDWDAQASAALRAASEPPTTPVAESSDDAEHETPQPPRRDTYEVPEGPIGPTPDLSDLAYGPSDAGPLTLGQAAFITEPEPAPDSNDPLPTRRLIIVIIPRSSGHFSLLP